LKEPLRKLENPFDIATIKRPKWSEYDRGIGWPLTSRNPTVSQLAYDFAHPQFLHASVIRGASFSGSVSISDMSNKSKMSGKALPITGSFDGSIDMEEFKALAALSVEGCASAPVGG
jgi:hypothetical protein